MGPSCLIPRSGPGAPSMGLSCPCCPPGGAERRLNSANGADLDVEAELHHVAVAHDVVLALDPRLAGGAGGGHGAGGDEVVVADDLGLDEAALEVGVDDAGGFRRGGTPADRPGPRLLGPCGKESLQAECLEADAGEAIETGFVLAVFAE